ncbi:MAG: YHYH protein [Pseudomonadota bacterium]
MRNPFSIPLFASAAIIALGVLTAATTASVSVSKAADQRCVSSDGMPDHATGTFPNRNNPHAMQRQNLQFCVPLNPVRGNTAQEVAVTGIAINGVKIRPGTADYYDARSPRGHSRDRSSGWNLDGMGARDMLGLDAQNAHVGHDGDYHYHGMPAALKGVNGGTLMGWAADGFEIHYVGSAARSSYMLLPGNRLSAPGGAHDGTYNEDWTFVKGAGNLDACNGGMVDGKYVYFATDTYPFFPRCLYGTQITRLR